MNSDEKNLPKITLFLLGGTISMQKGAEDGVVPTVTAEELCNAVPGLAQVAAITARTDRMVASSNLGFADAFFLKNEIENLAGATDGIVIVQGTDTLEEMAFVLDNILEVGIPVVMTAAMRSPDMASADGPGNMLAAVQCAATKKMAQAGVVVVMNDDIHPARYVRKCHTNDIAAFRSDYGARLGRVVEGVVELGPLPQKRTPVQISEDTPVPKVALIKATFNEGDDLLKLIGDSDYQGLVIEAFGAGHVSESWLDQLDKLVAKMPVVLASRTDEGRILKKTYGFKGSEIDLIARGLVPAGYYDGLKARLYLQLLMMAGEKISFKS